MQRWALTGGIASGKSTVARALGARGVPVVDADAIYHALLMPTGGRPSPLAQAVAARFEDVLEADGSISRKRLGQRVFAQPGEREALEAIVHPAIARAAQDRLDALEHSGAPLAVYDIPLLYERNLAASYHGVVVVWVPKRVQLERLMARDRVDLAGAEARLSAQWPLDEKRLRADVVLDNTGTTEALMNAVDAWLASVLPAPQ